MAFDAALAARFRDAIGARPGVTEQRMMGGLCFLLDGNMIGGADASREHGRRLMFRVGKQRVEQAAALPCGTPMVMGGRAMSGFYFVRDEACDDALLAQWMALALANAASLPPK